MKRSLPVWLLAVFPATIAAHALTYALSGRSAADGHHGWVVPLLEGSVTLLASAAIWLLGGVLVKCKFALPSLLERNALQIWPRMAIAQTALFVSIERIEGTPVGWLGCAAQIFIALLAAWLLCLFACALDVCALGTDRAECYLKRLCTPPLTFVGRQNGALAFAPAALACSSRFARPPPLA